MFGTFAFLYEFCMCLFLELSLWKMDIFWSEMKVGQMAANIENAGKISRIWDLAQYTHLQQAFSILFSHWVAIDSVTEKFNREMHPQ